MTNTIENVNNEDQRILDAKQSFEALKPKLQEYIKKCAETEYGAAISIGDFDLSDYQTWANIVPRLTVEGYSNPRQYVRTDERHPIDDMLVLYSGGTSGSPKETYYAPEDSGIKLSKDLEELIKSKEFLFVSESKDTVSFRLLKTWAEQAGVTNAEYSGFDNLNEFLELCKKSKGNVYITLQVSSARSLFSQLSELLQTQDDLSDLLPILDNLYLDLVAEPVKIEELQRWYDTLGTLFKTKPIISVPYAATEHKLIGLYHYQPGDTKISYKVIDGLLVETTDPDTGRAVSGFGNLVITDTRKEYGSLYPRYDSGDQATVHYERDGSAYISEVGRDPNKNQINLRGNKLYAHTFHGAIQEKLGPDLAIRSQFQLLENNDETLTVLKISIGGENIGPQGLEQIRLAVSEFMNDFDGYRFLWQGGQEVNPGMLYTAPNARIEFTYEPNLSWDNPKSFRRLPDTSIEKYYETQLEIAINDLLASLPRSPEEFGRYNIETLLDLRAKLISIIANDNYDRINPSYYESQQWLNFSEVAHNFNNQFEIEDEKQLSKLALNGELAKALEILGITGEQAHKEIEALQLKPNARVCFVGSGALPVSVIEYAKLGVEVTGIDIDEEAINIANQVVLSNNITGVSFECKNATDVNYEDYDAVVIAAMIEDKDTLITKIRSKTNIPILARCPLNQRAKILYSACSTRPAVTAKYTNSILEGHIHS